MVREYGSSEHRLVGNREKCKGKQTPKKKTPSEKHLVGEGGKGDMSCSEFSHNNTRLLNELPQLATNSFPNQGHK